VGSCGRFTARGLGGVRLEISDQHVGLVAALRRSFQGAAIVRY
jgi:transposase-like protein